LLALARAVMYLFRETIKCVTRICSTWLICMVSRYTAFKQDVKLHTWDKKIWTSGCGESKVNKTKGIQ
jgi:hypothetical protein